MSKRGVCNIILNGNRTNTGYSTGTGNELTTDGTWNFTFDNEGNITKAVHISDGLTWTFNYDNLNHLTGAQQRQTDAGTLLIQTTYLYDVHANLIERDVWTQVGGTTTTARYALDGNKVWADLDGTNTLQTRYLRGDAVDNLFARTSAGGAVGWYLADHLGSVRDIISNTGTVLDHIDYDPFGNITNETNASQGDRYKYALLQWDTQLGLYWAGRRFYYAPDGRWTSEDPVGFEAGDTNIFRYVSNRPTNLTDPTGLLVDGPLFDWSKLFKMPKTLPTVLAMADGEYENTFLGFGGLPQQDISFAMQESKGSPIIQMHKVTGGHDLAERFKKFEPKSIGKLIISGHSWGAGAQSTFGDLNHNINDEDAKIIASKLAPGSMVLLWSCSGGLEEEKMNILSKQFNAPVTGFSGNLCEGAKPSGPGKWVTVPVPDKSLAELKKILHDLGKH